MRPIRYTCFACACARDLVRVVVRLGGADAARERDGRRLEGDLAALVLDVDLDRVQPLAAHAHVLPELAGGDRERHGHVDAADLLRPLREERRLLVVLDRGRDAARLRRSAGQRSDHRGDRRGYHDQDPECDETSPSNDLAAALSSRPQSPASLVRELVPHRDREVCLPELGQVDPRIVEEMRTIRDAPRRIGIMILVTGGTGFVGSRIVHALRTEGRPVRCLVRKPERAAQLDAWGCELVRGRHDRPGKPRARRRRRRRGRPSGRDHHRQARGVRARHDARDRVARGRGRAGRHPPLRAHERARDERGDAGADAVLPRQMGDGADGSGGAVRAHDLPPQLRLRPGRRRASDVLAPRPLRARHTGRRAGHAADPADLGRRRRCLLREVDRPRRRSRPDVRDRRPGRRHVGRPLLADRVASSASGGRSCTCPSASCGRRRG